MKATPEQIRDLERRGLISTTVSTGPAPSKYRNERTEVDGLTFASKREARRYLDLREQQRAGLITDLRTQVEIPCVVNGVTVCVYMADMVYVRDGKRVTEDVKGMRTAVYKLKRRLLAALGTEIIEV